MSRELKKIHSHGVCCLAVILGILLVIHGFELVSVPAVREHRESLYVLTGFFLVAAGVAAAVQLWRN